MKGIYNKVISYLFFFLSSALAILAFVSYHEVGAFYLSASQDNVFFQRNPTNDSFFHSLQVGSFAFFVLIALGFFGIGWIILNFAREKAN
jgi:hypothetical protein